MSKELTFKTPKGTELAILDLRGKPYMQVPQRLVWFREEKPDWLCEVQFLEKTDKYVLAQAKIFDSEMKLRAVAHKVEHYAHFADALEKAETSAIGRALAMIGYGTQFAPEIYEEDRIVDSPTHSKNPIQSKPREIKNFATNETRQVIDPPGFYIGDYVIQCGKKYMGKTLSEVGPKEVESYRNYLIDSADKAGKPMTNKFSEFVEKADEYLLSIAGADFPPPPQFNDDNIPF